MRRYAAGLAAAVCMLLTVWCYLDAVNVAEYMKARNAAVTILNQTQPLTKARTEEMRETELKQENAFEFTAWCQQNGVWLETELGTAAEVSKISACGRTDLIFPESAWLDCEDPGGCLLDEKTAKTLFGSTNVVGMPIKCGKSEKIIRGILHNVEDTVVFMAEDDTEQLTHLTVRCDVRQSLRQVENEFMTRYGITGSIIKMQTMSGIAEGLILVLPLMTGIWMIRTALRAVHVKGARRGQRSEENRNRKEKAIYFINENKVKIAVVCLCTIAACACFWLILTHLQIPADMIPTKWSDFSFWSSLWEKERESLLILLLSEKQKPMQIWLEEFSAVLKYSLFSWIFGWGAYRMIRSNCQTS